MSERVTKRERFDVCTWCGKKASEDDRIDRNDMCSTAR